MNVDLSFYLSKVWTHTNALPQDDFLHKFHNNFFLQMKFADVHKQQQRHLDTWNNIQLNVSRRNRMVTTEQVYEKEKTNAFTSEFNKNFSSRSLVRFFFVENETKAKVNCSTFSTFLAQNLRLDDEEDEELLMVDKIDTWVDLLIDFVVVLLDLLEVVLILLLLLLEVLLLVHYNNFQHLPLNSSSSFDHDSYYSYRNSYYSIEMAYHLPSFHSHLNCYSFSSIRKTFSSCF